MGGGGGIQNEQILCGLELSPEFALFFKKGKIYPVFPYTKKKSP